MPRRNRPVKRVIAPDAVYQSEAISKFINVVMSRGKRSIAEKVVYDALARASKQAKKEPLEVFETAMRNATPLLEVKPPTRPRTQAARSSEKKKHTVWLRATRPSPISDIDENQELRK